MREIKFRAWDISTKQYNNFVEITCYTDGSLGITAGVNNNFPRGNTDNFILEQYTGLKDENGKDIYYGDIVSKYHNDKDEEKDIRIVEQIEGHTEVGCFNYYENSEDFTVIGNIHENKQK